MMIPESKTCADGTPKTLAKECVFKVSNCGSKDRNFFVQFFSLFTDPKHEELVAAIRAGEKTLQYIPESGDILINDKVIISHN